MNVFHILCNLVFVCKSMFMDVFHILCNVVFVCNPYSWMSFIFSVTYSFGDLVPRRELCGVVLRRRNSVVHVKMCQLRLCIYTK